LKLFFPFSVFLAEIKAPDQLTDIPMVERVEALEIEDQRAILLYLPEQLIVNRQ
jgi:hypothetical protein